MLSPSVWTCRLVRALSSDYGVGQWDRGAAPSLVWLIRALLQVKLRSLKRQADELIAVPSLQFSGLGSGGSPGPCLLQQVIYNSPLEHCVEVQPPGQHRHTMHGNKTHIDGHTVRDTHLFTHPHWPVIQCSQSSLSFYVFLCLASKSSTKTC